MAAREEQETVVTMGRVDDYMSIWTNNIVHVRALEKESRAKRVKPVYPGGIPYTDAELSAHVEEGWGVTYHVKAEDARILNVFGRKRKPMTEEEKKAAGERLRAGKAAS